MNSFYNDFLRLKRATIKSQGKFIFRSKDYISHKKEDLTFSPLQDTTTDIVGFIDGGQQILFESPSFLIGMVRVAVSLWRGSKRYAMKVKEFIVFLQAEEKGYTSKCYDMQGMPVQPFKTMDINTINHLDADDGESAISMLRRFSELLMAADIAGQVDVICIDGSLRCFSGTENHIMNQLLKQAAKRGVIVSGLQKSTSMMADNSSTIQSLEPSYNAGAWITSPLCINNTMMHPANIHIIKLHKDAAHRFVIDIARGYDQVKTGVSLLATSSDPLFIGYPYGMIDVDRLARIEDSRKEQSRLDIRKLLAGSNEFLDREILSKNAHEILDSMSF
ncbi:MAG: hypothetical protein ACOCU6_02845 [Nanoarchaeota archaeon]